ncbi:MAG: MBL fold metallo-hydrolase, partial [Clostridia bacterium]|nr:MBL fold metallo-hydrolase [Clostridia bacterium]
MKITNDIIYAGVNDRKIDLFEGQYVVPNGMAYNSYVILDEKTAVMDTVDRNFTHEWLNNLEDALDGRSPDYLVVQHMEPDHSANIVNFMKNYPGATVVSSAKAFAMMKNFFGTDFEDRRIVVGEGDTLTLGRHTLTFYTAPMVHWP